MPDISMCSNLNCPSRMQCMRYRAEPNPYRQAYMAFNPGDKKEKCNDFLDIVHWEGYDVRTVEKLTEEENTYVLQSRQKAHAQDDSVQG